MKARLAFIACAMGLLAASPAHACFSAADNQVVFTRDPPASVPSELTMFKVLVPRGLRQNDYYPIEVRMVEGPKVMADRLLIIPGQWTECTAWGDLEGPVYVVGSLIYGANGKMSLLAIRRPQR